MADPNQKVTTIDDLLEDLASPSPVPPASSPSPSTPKPSSQSPEQPKEDEKQGIPSSVGEYESSIRTMDDDLARLREGQQLSAIDVQKRVLSSAKAEAPLVQKSSKPVPRLELKISGPDKGSVFGRLFSSISSKKDGNLVQSDTNSQSSSGGTERASDGSPAGSTGGPVPVYQGQNDIDSTPRMSMRFKISKRLLIIILGGIVGAVAVYGGFIVLNQEPPVTIITPTPRPSRPPVNKFNIDSLLGGVSRINFSVTSTTTIKDFADRVNSEAVAKGQFRKVTLTNQASKSLDFVGILDTFSIVYPFDLKSIIASDSAVLIYGQREILDQPASGSGNNERLAVIVEIKNLASVDQVLSAWSPEMPTDLAPLFDISKEKLVAESFQDNTYRDVKIRYVNFSKADMSIDYAVIPASNQKNYLVITSSRESMYAAIDRLRGL